MRAIAKRTQNGHLLRVVKLEVNPEELKLGGGDDFVDKDTAATAATESPLRGKSLRAKLQKCENVSCLRVVAATAPDVAQIFLFFDASSKSCSPNS